MLTVNCAACNREAEMEACAMCSQIEDAERKATGEKSPQLVSVESPRLQEAGTDDA